MSDQVKLRDANRSVLSAVSPYRFDDRMGEIGNGMNENLRNRKLSPSDHEMSRVAVKLVQADAEFFT